MKLQGVVERGVFATGSHSEHSGLFLASDRGRYLLRRQGGHAFGDPVLDGLVGRRIVASGTIHNGVFLISSWRDLGPAAADDP